MKQNFPNIQAYSDNKQRSQEKSNQLLDKHQQNGLDHKSQSQMNQQKYKDSKQEDKMINQIQYSPIKNISLNKEDQQQLEKNEKNPLEELSIKMDQINQKDKTNGPSIPSFLLKTYEIVCDPLSDEIISWNEEGNGFIVKQVNLFSDQVLPKYFKHNNFSSFIRQLNMYDFHKTRNVLNQQCFQHSYFIKGKKSQLSKIKRKTSVAEKQQMLIKQQFNQFQNSQLGGFLDFQRKRDRKAIENYQNGMGNKLMLTQGEQNNFLSKDFDLQNLKITQEAQNMLQNDIKAFNKQQVRQEYENIFQIFEDDKMVNKKEQMQIQNDDENNNVDASHPKMYTNEFQAEQDFNMNFKNRKISHDFDNNPWQQFKMFIFRQNARIDQLEQRIQKIEMINQKFLKENYELMQQNNELIKQKDNNQILEKLFIFLASQGNFINTFANQQFQLRPSINREIEAPRIGYSEQNQDKHQSLIDDNQIQQQSNLQYSQAKIQELSQFSDANNQIDQHSDQIQTKPIYKNEHQNQEDTKWKLQFDEKNVKFNQKSPLSQLNNNLQNEQMNHHKRNVNSKERFMQNQNENPHKNQRKFRKRSNSNSIISNGSNHQKYYNGSRNNHNHNNNYYIQDMMRRIFDFSKNDRNFSYYNEFLQNGNQFQKKNDYKYNPLWNMIQDGVQNYLMNFKMKQQPQITLNDKDSNFYNNLSRQQFNNQKSYKHLRDDIYYENKSPIIRDFKISNDHYKQQKVSQIPSRENDLKKRNFNCEIMNTNGPIFDDQSQVNPIEKNDFSSVTEILNRYDSTIQPTPLNPQYMNSKNYSQAQKMNKYQYNDEKKVFRDEFEKPDPQESRRKKNFEDLSSINASPRQKQITLSVNPYLNLDELPSSQKDSDNFKKELQQKLGPQIQSPYSKHGYQKSLNEKYKSNKEMEDLSKVSSVSESIDASKVLRNEHDNFTNKADLNSSLLNPLLNLEKVRSININHNNFVPNQNQHYYDNQTRISHQNDNNMRFYNRPSFQEQYYPPKNGRDYNEMIYQNPYDKYFQHPQQYDQNYYKDHPYFQKQPSMQPFVRNIYDNYQGPYHDKRFHDQTSSKYTDNHNVEFEEIISNNSNTNQQTLGKRSWVQQQHENGSMVHKNENKEIRDHMNENSIIGNLNQNNHPQYQNQGYKRQIYNQNQLSNNSAQNKYNDNQSHLKKASDFMENTFPYSKDKYMQQDRIKKDQDQDYFSKRKFYNDDKMVKSKYPDPEIDQKQLDQLDKIINVNYKNSNEKNLQNSEQQSNKNYKQDIQREKESVRKNGFRDKDINRYQEDNHQGEKHYSLQNGRYEPAKHYNSNRFSNSSERSIEKVD